MSVDLSVVIVTYNSEPFIAACLDSLMAATKTLTTEIFVYDGGSKDGGPAIVAESYPSVVLIRGENIGFSAGNNMALPLCTGDKILLLNPDTVLLPGSLARLMGFLDSNSAYGAVGPALVFADGVVQDHSAHRLPTPYYMISWLFLLDKLEWRLRFRGKRTRGAIPPRSSWLDGFTLLSWTRDRATEITYLSGACLMFRKAVLEQVGLLDGASPLYLDDIDYCRRIQDAGWRLFYAADAYVTHYWQQSSASVQRDADFYALLCHSVWIYLRKHHGSLAGWAYRFAALAAGLLRSSICLVAIPLARGKGHEWGRHLHMATALLRWSANAPSVPATLHFAPAPATPMRLVSSAGAPQR